MLTIDEHIGIHGQNVVTRVQVVPEREADENSGPALRVTIDDEIVGDVSMAAVVHVMKRYAKELSPEVSLEGPRLELGEGLTLQMFRHRARYDVIARDFLVLAREGDQPIAELSTSIAAALIHFAKASRRTQ